MGGIIETLRKFILFGLILVVVSIVITLNIFFQQNYQQEMAAQLNRQQLLIAKAISSNIKSHFEHIEEELKAFARLINRRGMKESDFNSFVEDVFAEEGKEKGVALHIFDWNGKLVYPEGVAPSNENKRMFELSRSIPAGKVHFFDHIQSHGMVEIATPLPVGDRENSGVIIVSIDIDSVSRKYLEPIQSGERGYAWMMDASGTLIFHPSKSDMVGKNIYNAVDSCFNCHSSFKTEEMILSTPDIGFSSYVSPHGEDKLLAYSRVSISTLSWIVCVSVPYSEVTASIQKSMRLHSTLVLFIFAMTVVGSFIVVITNRGRIKAEEKALHLERHQALEQEIIHAKNYLENILESTQTIIMVIGDDFVIRTVNSAFEAIFGLSKDGIVGTSFLETFPFTSPDDRERFIRIISRCLEGKVRGIPEYHINIAGQARSMNVVLSPLRIDGVINGVILSASDVSEAVTLKEQIHQYAHELEVIVKERTKELRSEKEKLNALVNSIEAGICIFEDDGSLVWANRVFGDWLPEGGVSSIRMDDIFAGKHTFEELKNEITSKKIFQEIVYRDFGRKAGYFQTTSTPLVSTEDRKQILLLIQDVTEVRKAEEQMMQSEKLSALARLSAGVAHEIGNPLTSISSYVQILKEMDFDDFTKEALSTISRQINRIAMIVRQMSSFTKAKPGMAGQSVREIVDSTLQLVKYDRRMKKVEINEDMPDDAGSVKVNGDQLEQVFINIVLNAADAMQSGGSLNVSASRSDGFVDISFRDTGSGITREHIERIFDPFFTTKETGTGLGLAVSYTIVRSLGGTIQVSSVPGDGTTFTVRLPIYEG